MHTTCNIKVIQYVTSVLVFMYAEMKHDTSSSKDRDIKSLDFAGFKDGQETFQTPIHTFTKEK